MPRVLHTPFVSQVRAGKADIAEAYIKNLRHPPVVEHIEDASAHVQRGTVFPENPAVGQCFYHTEVDTLYVYRQRWIPLVSYGEVQLFVDREYGNDSNTGFSDSPVRTLQAAVNRVAPINYDNVYINIVRAGDYAGATISNVSLPAGKSLYIRGTSSTWTQHLAVQTATGGVRGSAATQGSVTRTGAGWTTNAYANKWIRFEDNTTTAALRGVWRLIDSNTATTITIVGTFPAAPVSSDTFRVFTPGVEFDSGSYGVRAYHCTSVVPQYLQSSVPILAGTGSDMSVQYCWLSGNLTSWVLGSSVLGFLGTLCAHRVVVRDAYFHCYWSKLTGAAESYVYPLQGASVDFGWGSITDGGGGSPYGIRAVRNSATVCQNSVADGYARFRNHGSAALVALEGAQIIGTANNQYSGNAANETAVAASYGYID